MASTFDFDRILSNFEEGDLPPLHLWQPELCGDIDIHIDKQGVWRHCGEAFTRLQIPKMFARILCKEGDDYFLKTPVEKWRIQVEDSPFYFIHMRQEEKEGNLYLNFVTNTEDIVTLSSDHPLILRDDDVNEGRFPYIYVRGDMYGRLSRNLYYELVDLAEIDENERKIYISSAGEKFLLGNY